MATKKDDDKELTLQELMEQAMANKENSPRKWKVLNKTSGKVGTVLKVLGNACAAILIANSSFCAGKALHIPDIPNFIASIIVTIPTIMQAVKAVKSKEDNTYKLTPAKSEDERKWRIKALNKATILDGFRFDADITFFVWIVCCVLYYLKVNMNFNMILAAIATAGIATPTLFQAVDTGRELLDDDSDLRETKKSK